MNVGAVIAHATWGILPMLVAGSFVGVVLAWHSGARNERNRK